MVGSPSSNVKIISDTILQNLGLEIGLSILCHLNQVISLNLETPNIRKEFYTSCAYIIYHFYCKLYYLNWKKLRLKNVLQHESVKTHVKHNATVTILKNKIQQLKMSMCIYVNITLNDVGLCM